MSKKNKGTMKDIFSLNLICFLRCNGLKETGVGFNENTKKVYFIYEQCEELDRLVKEYRDSDCTVRLHSFIGEFKSLKEEMYQHLKKFTN